MDGKIPEHGLTGRYK